MVEHVMRTQDGRIRVYLYTDQTAEITDSRGSVLTDRMSIHLVGRRLAAMGVDSSELVAD